MKFSIHKLFLFLIRSFAAFVILEIMTNIDPSKIKSFTTWNRLKQKILNVTDSLHFDLEFLYTHCRLQTLTALKTCYFFSPGTDTALLSRKCSFVYFYLKSVISWIFINTWVYRERETHTQREKGALSLTTFSTPFRVTTLCRFSQFSPLKSIVALPFFQRKHAATL